MYGDRMKNRRIRLGLHLRRTVTQGEVAAGINETRAANGNDKTVDTGFISRAEKHGCNKSLCDEAMAALDVIEALSKMAVVG